MPSRWVGGGAYLMLASVFPDGCGRPPKSETDANGRTQKLKRTQTDAPKSYHGCALTSSAPFMQGGSAHWVLSVFRSATFYFFSISNDILSNSRVSWTEWYPVKQFFNCFQPNSSSTVFFPDQILD